MKGKLKKINWLGLVLELLVVFIGVTLAFALDNWSENKHDRKLEKQYKTALALEMEGTISRLESSINRDSIWIDRSENLLQQIKTDQQVVTDSLLIIINMMGSINKINPPKSTYLSMERSGEINLISDFDLKTRLNSYFGGQLDQINLLNQKIQSMLDSTILPFAFKSYDIRNEVFNSPEQDAVQCWNYFQAYSQLKKQLHDHHKSFLYHSEFLKEGLEK